jgi:hypothetical protein
MSTQRSYNSFNPSFTILMRFEIDLGRKITLILQTTICGMN